MVGHLKILREVRPDPMTSKCNDYLLKELIFDKNYQINIFDRADWIINVPLENSNQLTWYTDGSKSESGTGLGIYGSDTKISLSLGWETSIFQAEISAIKICADLMISRGVRDAHILIASDSQAALKSLNSFEVDSKLVKETILTLNKLGLNNDLVVGWVPGHSNIEGNETADLLAKRGAESSFTGPEPWCAVPQKRLFENVHIWSNEETLRWWTSQTGLRQAKRFISPCTKKFIELLKLPKSDLRILTGFYTGHFQLRYHLNKIGLSIDSLCRFCGEKDETSEHLLCECDVFSRRRYKILGKSRPNPRQIWELSPKKVLDFIRNLKLLE